MVLSTSLFRQHLPLLPPDRCKRPIGINVSTDLCRIQCIVKVCFRPVAQAQPCGFDIRQAPTVDACTARTSPCSSTSAATYCPVVASASRRCTAKSSIGSILALVCLVGNVKAEATQQIIEGPARVIDGDTLEVSSALFCKHSCGITARDTQLHRKCRQCRCLESASAYLVWTPQRRPSHAATRMAGPTPVVRVSTHAVLVVNTCRVWASHTHEHTYLGLGLLRLAANLRWLLL